MKKTVLKFGLIIGLIIGVFMVISTMTIQKDMDYDKGAILGFSTMFVVFLSMFFGIRSYRNRELGGVISFGRALAMGLLITLISSMVYSLCWTVYTEVAGVDFITEYIEMKEKTMIEEEKSAEEITKMKEDSEFYVEMYKNPFTKFAITIIEPLPIGVPLSLLFALILALWKEGPKREEVFDRS